MFPERPTARGLNHGVPEASSDLPKAIRRQVAEIGQGKPATALRLTAADVRAVTFVQLAGRR